MALRPNGVPTHIDPTEGALRFYLCTFCSRRYPEHVNDQCLFGSTAFEWGGYIRAMGLDYHDPTGGRAEAWSQDLYNASKTYDP